MCSNFRKYVDKKNQYFNIGFSQESNVLLRPNHNLKGNILRVVMPGVHWTFAKILSYPNGSKIRTGFDFHALQYISKALHFKYERVTLHFEANEL